MISDMDALEIFLVLCEERSVQATARRLGLESSAVSKKIARLEKQLGRNLFDKTKRPFVMTKDADAIYESARKIQTERLRIDSYYRQLQDEESEVVRMMIGNSQARFAPDFIAEYADEHPSMRFNLITPPDVDEFMAGKADIINLSGQGQLTQCVEIPRGRMVFVPVASPEYIRAHGPITRPEQLGQHRVFSNLYPHRFDFKIKFPLVKNGLAVAFEGIESIRFSNVLMTYRGVLNGAGVGLCLPLALCIDDLENGSLVPVLNGWHRPCVQSVVACKEDDWKIRHLRMFSNWWAKRLSAHEKRCEQRLVKLFGRAFLENLTR